MSACIVFCFTDPATTEIYTLSLHDALPSFTIPAGTGPATKRHATRRDSRHGAAGRASDRKSTRLNSSHRCISYAVFCLKKKKPPAGSAGLDVELLNLGTPPGLGAALARHLE